MFHRALTAATKKVDRLAIRRPNITEGEYYSLMKEVNAGIEEAETDQLRFYLSFSVSERRAFLGLILTAIDTKTSIFAKVHRLIGKEWTSVNEEILETLRHSMLSPTVQSIPKTGWCLNSTSGNGCLDERALKKL